MAKFTALVLAMTNTGDSEDILLLHKANNQLICKAFYCTITEKKDIYIYLSYA